MNEKKNDWYKKLDIPEGTYFKTFKGFPFFEIKLNNDLKPNGDFYLYIFNKKDDSYYGAIKVDENKNIKEIYRDATEEEIKKYNINTMYLKYGSIFISEKKDIGITHVHWWIDGQTVLRKDVNNNHIIKGDMYTPSDNYNYDDLPSDYRDMLKKYDAQYLFVAKEFNSTIMKPHCIGFADRFYNTSKYSKCYDYLIENILNLKNINF